MTSRPWISRNILRTAMAAIGLSCLGAAVFAAPLSVTPRSKLVAPAEEKTVLPPLAAGPSITLAKAGIGEDEDCVRVTKMTGPDGQVYPTRGIICR